MTRILTLRETAAWLHCGRAVLYRMVAARQIPHFKIGSDIRFHEGAVQDWMRACSATTTERWTE